MAFIGYLKRENKKHKDGYEYLEVYTTPAIKERCWWFKREVGWVDSPRFVMVRNRYGWTYLCEKRTCVEARTCSCKQGRSYRQRLPRRDNGRAAQSFRCAPDGC